MPHRLLFALAACLLLAGAAPAQPVRLLAEAEDFTVEKGAWKRVPYRENYYASTFAITFLSRMACLGAPAQVKPGEEAVATQDIDVPADGSFHVLTRYEQPYNFSAEFTVAVEQNGRVVYRETFGRLDDPKIWALNGHKRVPMERYGWGGTDNIVWQQKGLARLARGKATLRLIAGPQLDGGKPRAMAARRHVDVICLTDDAEGMEAQKKTGYLEFDGWLVQAGDLFVRVTNPKNGHGPCVPVLAPDPMGQHSPYYVHVRDWPTVRVLKSGRLTEPTKYLLAGPRLTAVAEKHLAAELKPGTYWKADPKNPKAPPALTIPDAEYLQPGETSGWVPLGQALDALNDSTWAPQALNKNKAPGVALDLEFAVPDGKGGLRAVKKASYRTGPGAPGEGALEIPGNVAANPTIRTQAEALRWLLGEVAKFPRSHPAPKRFPVYGILSFSGALTEGGPLGELSTRLALALGSNTLVGDKGWAKTLGVPDRRSLIVAHWPAGTAEKQVAEAQKNGTAKNIKVVSFGDEIHIEPLAPQKGKEAEFNARFVAWLNARGIPGAGGASYTADARNPWYYYSKLYSTEAGIDLYAKDTRTYEEKLGKGVLTGANYSPHANFLVTELQWVRPFKRRAMTMPWSEDYVWQIPEFSVQVTGYQTSGLRAGAKYHDLPIMMYVMPHSPGNTPRDFRLSFYTCVAHGTRMVNYFCASPLAVGATENYVATGDLGMWRELHRVTHEAGAFEDYVVDGKVRPAKVGLLLSSVDEIHTGDTNFSGGIHNLERKAVYYALRHAGVPVDFLSEDDVIDGLANDYRVIYVTQQSLHSKAVKALAKWAAAGGTVVALCGGGFTDEFGRSNPEAGALYGVKAQSLYKDPKLPMALAKQDLPPYRPLDRVSWGRGKGRVAGVPVLIWKQSLTAGDGKTLGTYADGSPAVVEKAHGKGRAVLFGFFPGMAYLRSGLPLLPADRGGTDAGYNHYLPTKMDPALRRALVEAFLPAGFARPVECSAELVEATCIDTRAAGGKPARLAVPLMNYSGRPVKSLTVHLPGLGKVRSVKSVGRGALRHETRDGATTVTLPLEVADMLLVDR